MCTIVRRDTFASALGSATHHLVLPRAPCYRFPLLERAVSGCGQPGGDAAGGPGTLPMVTSAGVGEDETGTQVSRACSLHKAGTFREGMGHEHER